MSLNEAHKSHLGKRSGRYGLVHMARPGIPPRAMTIVRRAPCSIALQTSLPESLEPGPGTFPLAPQYQAQSPSNPLVQFLEHSLYIRQSVVVDPTSKNRVELLDSAGKALTTSSPE